MSCVYPNVARGLQFLGRFVVVEDLPGLCPCELIRVA